MKKIILSFVLLFFLFFSFGQCPNLFEAMVNSCGATEGNNEFVVFTTSTTATASSYTLNYGSTNPPTVNNLAGSDAAPITGTGSVTTTGTCSIVNVTLPSTSIPAGSRVIFIPTSLDQNYDVTGLCNGSSPLYVVYIKINSNGGSNSSWNNAGTLSNSATTPRYLQITYTGSAACNGSNAPVKHYTAAGNWPVLSGTAADGNFVTWNDTTAGYYNNGCTTIVVPVTLLDFNVSFAGNRNIVNWQTSQEINTANFLIEKSYDAQNFILLATIPAAGFSNEIKNYQLSDNHFEYRTTYYRLKTIDRDGKNTISRLVKIRPATSGLSIGNIYPVPADKQLNFQWNSPVKNNSSLVILDITGRIIRSGTIQSLVGFNQQSIDVSTLEHGQYILKIILEDKVSTAFFTR